MPHYSKNLTGRKFGHLTAIRPTDLCERTNRTVIWLCRCDCGEYKLANSNRLQRGGVRSCGCLRPGRKRRRDTWK